MEVGGSGLGRGSVGARRHCNGAPFKSTSGVWAAGPAGPAGPGSAADIISTTIKSWPPPAQLSPATLTFGFQLTLGRVWAPPRPRPPHRHQPPEHRPGAGAGAGQVLAAQCAGLLMTVTSFPICFACTTALWVCWSEIDGLFNQTTHIISRSQDDIIIHAGLSRINFKTTKSKQEIYSPK